VTTAKRCVNVLAARRGQPPYRFVRTMRLHWPSPRRGRGTAIAVDEDVGTFFVEKHFDVRSRVGVYHPLSIAEAGDSPARLAS